MIFLTNALKAQHIYIRTLVNSILHKHTQAVTTEESTRWAIPEVHARHRFIMGTVWLTII